MFKSLSKRERVLLTILASIVSVYVVLTFVITPLLNRYNETSEALANVEMKRQQAQLDIGSRKSLEQAYENSRAAYLENCKLFPLKNNNTQVDEKITSILKSLNLTPSSLQIGKPLSIMRQAVKSSGEDDGDNTADKEILVIGKKNGTEIAQVSVIQVTVIMATDMDLNQLRSLMSEVEKEPDICISSLNMKRDSNITVIFDIFVRNE